MSTKQSQPVSERLSDGHGAHLYFKDGKLMKYVDGVESEVGGGGGGGGGTVKTDMDMTRCIILSGTITVTTRGLKFESPHPASGQLPASNWTGVVLSLRVMPGIVRYLYVMDHLEPFGLNESVSTAFMPVVVDGEKSFLTLPNPAGHDVLQWGERPAMIQIAGLPGSTKPNGTVTWEGMQGMEIGDDTYISAPFFNGYLRVGEQCPFTIWGFNHQYIE